MPKYVDGYVLTVKKKDLATYRKMAREAAKTWKKFGALEYREAVGDDMRPKGFKLTFPQLTKRKRNEVVVFAYVLYKSRSHRDKVNKAVTEYFIEKYGEKVNDPMPFDMNRMTYGGFTTFTD